MGFFSQFEADFDYFFELIAGSPLSEVNNQKVAKMAKNHTGSYSKFAFNSSGAIAY